MIRHAGIIAAGHGERLKGHSPLPKPLVSVAGRPLIYWVVRSLAGASVRSMTLLVNSRGAGIRDFLRSEFPDIAWTFLMQDTASSWESFRIVSASVASQADFFLMSTADALISHEDAARFSSSIPPSAEGALALTAFVDDEKPLWARLDASGWIAALGPGAEAGGLVTAGLYAMSSGLASEPAAREHGRLRDYWMSLVQGGRRLAGVRVGKAVDVDRPADLREAEAFLLGSGR